MRDFEKVKALERLYSSLSTAEFDPRAPISNNYQLIDFTVKLLGKDLTEILDVLAEAIHREREA